MLYLVALWSIRFCCESEKLSLLISSREGVVSALKVFRSFSWHELMFFIWFTSIKELNPFVQLPALQWQVLKLLIKKTQLQKSRSFSLRTLNKYFLIWNSTFFTIVLKFVKVGIKLLMISLGRGRKTRTSTVGRNAPALFSQLTWKEWRRWKELDWD